MHKHACWYVALHTETPAGPQDTQAYPPAYGEAVAAAWIEDVFMVNTDDAEQRQHDPESDSDSEYVPHDFPLADLESVASFVGVTNNTLLADYRS